MSELLGPALVLIPVLVVAFGLARLFELAITRAARQASARRDEKPGVAATPEPPQAPVETPVEDPAQDPFEAFVEAVGPAVAEASRPNFLLDSPIFKEAAAWAAANLTLEELVRHYMGERAVPAWIALEAIALHPEGKTAEERILTTISRFSPWTFYFGIRALASFRKPEDPFVGPILCRGEDSWLETPRPDALDTIAAARLEGGEPMTFASALEGLDAKGLERVDKLVSFLRSPVSRPLREELEAHRGKWIDLEVLKAVGKIWTRSDAGGARAPILHKRLESDVHELLRAMESPAPRPILLVGEPGSGKRTLFRELARRLLESKWTVFEAGSSEINAGQVWVGSLEGRIRDLTQQLRTEKRAVWFIPDFPGLLETGRSLNSQRSAMDALQSFIERGELIVVGLCEPSGLDRISLAKPGLVLSFLLVRVDPLPAPETLELAVAWAERHKLPEGRPRCTKEVLLEAGSLLPYAGGDTVSPGNLLALLTETLERLTIAGESRVMEPHDLIETLSRRTGLPSAMLDDRLPLDLQEVRRYFEERVMGQPEAVTYLVERIAMIKAGLTDPGRPMGVFLFAGPTGTGKTELAKTLAGWLYGSASRLLRIDMSELQNPRDVTRIFGEEGQPGVSLVQQIRQQPFSVVLLDEFEKADEKIWNIFLQAFDDGRLTDSRGRTASFRNAIFILTSNLGGATSPTSLGFAKPGEQFSGAAVLRAISTAFSKEFVNRLDRIIVFRPLDRATMRDILDRELRLAFERRGFRKRPWAVEWDDDAREFLLSRGFTLDLGARPLRRAVEQILLEPLARTIAAHEVPEGDQFLFVRAKGDGLVVDFVDPDAGRDDGRPPEAAARKPGIRDALKDAGTPTPQKPEAPYLRELVLGAEGESAELAFLRRRIETLGAQIQSAWGSSKESDLAMTSLPGFWDDPGRFEILDLYEYRDRIERALHGASSLLERLESARQRRAPADLVRTLAQKVYLLETAVDDVQGKRPREAFLCIEPSGERSRESPESATFGRRLAAMYLAWAEARGMRVEDLTETGRPELYLVVAVSGFGSYSILAPEDGLHVLEEPAEEGTSFDRVVLRVRVVPRLPGPPPRHARELLREARRAFEQDGATPPVRRKYRDRPSPLVRDGNRGWRTGRADLVFAGGFDLLGEG